MNQNFIRRATLLLFVASEVCAQAGSVHGEVRESASGAPVADLTVHVAGTMNSPTPTAVTDAEGRYAIGNLPLRALSIVTSGASHPSVSRSVKLSAGEDAAVDLIVPSNPMLSGRVWDPEGKPAANVPVWAVQSQYSGGILRHSIVGPRVTDKNGRYEFENLLTPVRAYFLLADVTLSEERVSGEPKPLDKRQPIQAPTYYGDAISVEAATPVVLQPGEQREGADIKLRKAGDYCVDGNLEVLGKPASLLVTIHERPLIGTSLMRLNVISDEKGAFRACGLTAGEYRLSTNNPHGVQGAADFAIADSDIHGVRLPLDSVPLHLQLAWDGDPPPASEPKVPDSIHVVRTGESSVVIYTAGGERSISNDVWQKALAELSRTRPTSVHLNGISNDVQLVKAAANPYDGPFADDMPAGDYEVNVTTAPDCCYPKEVTLNGIPVSDRVVHIAPGTSGTLRVVLAYDGGEITGQVKDSDSNVVPESTVVLIPKSATTAPLLAALAQQTRTDTAGGFSFKMVAPGKYRVMALSRAYGQDPQDIDKLLAALSKAQDLEVGPKGHAQVNLQPVPID